MSLTTITAAANNKSHRKNLKSVFSCGWIYALGCLLWSLWFAPVTSFAAVSSVTPITWNIIGLDSNTPAFGPNRFPVGARICSVTGETDLPVTFTWDSANLNINLRAFSANPVIIPSIPAGGCADAFFEVEVTKTAAAFDTLRSFHISAGGVSTPMPREIKIEHLVSQGRNAITDMQFGTNLASLTSVPNGGSMDLIVGNTYYIRMIGYTATQGYEQLESFINFPNTIFQILSVDTTYSADSSTTVANPNDKLYGDGCLWENDPNSPNYLACNSEGKIGGNISVTYQVKILSIGSGQEPLNTLIHDFSGSSFHYNSDFSTTARYANLIDPATVSIAKKFTPTPIVSGGISTLTITLSNPNGGALSDASFIDTFPSTTSSPPALGDMVVAPTPAISNSCGGMLTDDSDGLLAAGDRGIKLVGGTIPAQSSCTIKINVTAAAEDLYTNTTNNLRIGTTDTGKTASAVLTIDNSAFPAPQPPSSCPGLEVELVRWNMNNGTTTPPLYSSKAIDVAAAPTTQATYSGTGAQAIDTTTPGTPNYSWKATDGWSNDATGFPNANAPYFQFEIDTSKYGGVRMTFLHALFDNQGWGGTNRVYVYSSADGGAFSTIYNQLTTKNSWRPAITANALSTGTTNTIFRINATASSGTKTSDGLYLDDVIITGCAVPAVPPTPPTMTKSFTPATVAAGGPSTLAFTITNPNASALSKVAFEDILPAGITVADGTASACNGTNNLVTTAIDGKIVLTSGTLAGGASCIVSVTVTAASAGQHDNVSGAISASESGANTTTSGVATASLLVLAPPTISKSFSPNPIFTNGTATLTFTVTNPNTGNGMSGVAFTDTFPRIASGAPGNMTVAAPLTTTNTCGAGVLQDDLGGGLTTGDPGIRLSGGTIAAGSTCTVSINVTAPTAGTYNNSSGTVSHILNAFTGNGNTASDSLWVEAASPGIALVKEVGPSATGPWTSFLATTPGTTIYYHYTVENYGDVALTSVIVTDANPSASTASCNWANLPIAVAGNDNHIVECISGPFTALAGSWQYTATATDTPTTVTDTSSARYATAGLSLVKSSIQAQFIAAGDVLNYSFLVTNSGSAPLVGPITVADNKANDESCPAVNTVGDFDNYFEPGESLTCTASYTVTAADVTAKLVTNTASASGGGFTSATVSKIVPLAADLSVVKTNNVNGKTSDSGTFAWTLTVTNAATAGSSTFADGQILLQDDLPDSGATYNTPATATNSAGTTGTIACAIVANTLTCMASGGAVTIPPGESFSIAVTVNVTAAIVLVNPRTPGLCQVDPTPVITEINEANNSCTDTVSAAMPSLLVVKSAQTYSDPINGTTSPKAIPGAFVTYTIQVINSGFGTVDADTTVITDAIPVNTELFVGDIDGVGPVTGPILFTDGAGATMSGLSYTFTSMDSTTDNLAFSGDNGADLYGKNDTAPDSNDCDPTVTNIKIPLSGIFNGSDGTNHPTFNVKFRVRIK